MSFIVPKLEDDDYSPEVIEARVKEVCPDAKIDELSIQEINKAVDIVFEIIGYELDNPENSINQAFESMESDDLSDYVYQVWRHDYGVI